MEAVRESLGALHGPTSPPLPDLMQASTDNEWSLQAMASNTEVLISAVGPYRFHGFPVASAAAREGCIYLDISGEPDYLERVAAELDAPAKASGALLVGACGMDSVPSDMMTVHGTRAFKATHGTDAHSVALFLTLACPSARWGQALLNIGTWNSLVESLAHADDLRRARRSRERVPVAYPGPRPPRAGRFDYNTTLGAYAVPFMGADASIVRRSQEHLHLSNAGAADAEEKPVHCSVFLTIPGRLQLYMLMLWGLFFGFMCKFAFTRSILLRFPRLCSLGFVSPDGPSEENRQNMTLTLTCQASGVSADGEPVQQISSMRCDDPGYSATAAMCVQCALTAINERDSLPKSGVHTTASAFRASTLLARLANAPCDFATPSPPAAQ